MAGAFRGPKPSPEGDRTYNRVTELVRAGKSIAEAIRIVADLENITESQARNRYYSRAPKRERSSSPAKKPGRPATPAPAPGRPERDGAELDPYAGVARLADALEGFAATLAELAPLARELERDAGRYRRMRAALEEADGMA